MRPEILIGVCYLSYVGAYALALHWGLGSWQGGALLLTLAVLRGAIARKVWS